MDLKERRRQLGLTQAQLAREAEVSVAAIQKWERNGISKAQVAPISRIAKALGLRIEDLLEEAPHR